MSEKILSILFDNDIKWDKPEEQRIWHRHGEGYVIETTARTIKIAIEDERNCCEVWGYITSEDNLDEYVGTEFRNVRVTNTALESTDIKMSELGFIGLDLPGIMFVDLETDKGVLQFVLYNAHNGYYGHEVVVLMDRKYFPDYTDYLYEGTI